MISKIKYPRSKHLHFSEKSSDDDVRHENDNHFHDKEVVCTIKMDGENSSLYNSVYHARSLDSKIDSEDRRWIENLRKIKIEGNIPDSYRICGENLFYRHTCEYDDLESLFYVFSIWDDNTCLSWKDTKEWCEMLGLVTVPVFYEGIYDKDKILAAFKEYCNTHKVVEGFVVRLVDSFNIENFEFSLSKFVRNTFVIPDQHWRYAQKTINKLKSGLNPWTII